MKVSKWLWAIAFSFISLAAFSQPNNGGQKGKKDRMARLQKQLSLSDEQVEQWTAIDEKYAPEMASIRDNMEWERSTKFEKMQILREKMDEEVKGVLTEEQYTTYLETRKKRGKKRGKNKTVESNS